MPVPTNTLLLILLPVFFLGAVYIGLCFVFTNYWKKNSRRALKELHAELRGLHTQSKQIWQGLQDFSPQDPPPYAEMAAKLEASQQKIQPAVEEAQRGYVALQEKARFLERKTSWFTILAGVPIQWLRLNQEVNRLKETQLQIRAETLTALEYLENMEKAGLEVARKVQDVRELDEQTSQGIQRLAQRNIQGELFDEAKKHAESLHHELNKIPKIFYEGGSEEILKNAAKESISQSFLLAEDLKPQFENLLNQAQEWERQSIRAGNSVGNLNHLLQQTIHDRRQTLDTLALDDHDVQIQQIQTIARSLQQTLGHLEVDSIAQVTQEADRLFQIVQGLHGQLSKAKEQSPQLESLLGNLNAQLRELSLLVGSLATRSAYPLRWTQSTASLAALNRQVNSLGDAKKKRTPEQVAQDLEKAQQIVSQLVELDKHCNQMGAQHQQLVQMLESPEFTGIPPWLKNAQQVAAQVGEYPFENWRPKDKASALLVDLQQFQADYQHLTPSDRSAAVAENELPQLLAGLIHLSEAYRLLHDRMEKIQDRLQELKLDEKNAFEQLENMRMVLSQAGFLVRSNPYLEQAANQEVETLNRQIANHLKVLELRKQGILEEKIKAIQASSVRLEQSNQQWNDALTLDIRQKLDTVSKSLVALDAIAPLNDGAVDEARRVLSEGQAYRSNLAMKSRLSLDGLLSELKRRSDFWHSCAASIQALNDQAGPLLEAYQAAAESRKVAQEAISEAINWLRQSRGWPPSTVDLEYERNELSQLEARWQSQQNTPQRAIQLVGQFSQLAGQYQTLVEKVRQGLERAAHERTQVEDLENDLLELAQRWQEQRQAYQDEPEVSQEIRTMLGELEREMATLRRKAQQKSNSYEQILQTLKNLHRKVRFFQVELDEEHALDVAGNIQRKR